MHVDRQTCKDKYVYRYTCRQINMQTDVHVDIQTCRLQTDTIIDIYTSRQKHMQKDRHSDRYTNIQIDKQTDGQKMIGRYILDIPDDFDPYLKKFRQINKGKMKTDSHDEDNKRNPER